MWCSRYLVGRPAAWGCVRDRRREQSSGRGLQHAAGPVPAVIVERVCVWRGAPLAVAAPGWSVGYRIASLGIPIGSKTWLVRENVACTMAADCVSNFFPSTVESATATSGTSEVTPHGARRGSLNPGASSGFRLHAVVARLSPASRARSDGVDRCHDAENAANSDASSLARRLCMGEMTCLVLAHIAPIIPPSARAGMTVPLTLSAAAQRPRRRAFQTVPDTVP